MKGRAIRWILCFLCAFTLPLAACGSEQSSSSSQGGSYKETKSMVIDILKTDEGKKAIYEALSTPQSSGEEEGGGSESGSGGGEEGQGGGQAQGGGTMGVKMLLPSNTSSEVRMAVKETITSPEYKKEIEKIMTDPQFAGDFAKAINSQSKDLHLQLIKDPTYQKSVSEMMKSPEVMKIFLDLTKTPDYRKQSMTVMQEAMQSPIFRMEVLELLKTVVQEQLQPSVEKEPKKEEKSGGEEESGQSEEESSGGGEESS